MSVMQKARGFGAVQDCLYREGQVKEGSRVVKLELPRLNLCIRSLSQGEMPVERVDRIASKYLCDAIREGIEAVSVSEIQCNLHDMYIK